MAQEVAGVLEIPQRPGPAAGARGAGRRLAAETDAVGAGQLRAPRRTPWRISWMGCSALAPNVRVLATSREVLGVSGEVNPSGAPALPARPRATERRSKISRAPGRRGSSWSGRSTVPSAFVLTPENAGAVVEVCRRARRHAPGHRARGGEGRGAGGRADLREGSPTPSGSSPTAAGRRRPGNGR